MNQVSGKNWILASLGIAACAAAGLAAQTTPSVVQGGSTSMYGGTVNSWATVNASGAVETVGVTIPMKSIENTPAADPHADPEHPDKPFIVDFPATVKATTSLDHLELYWEAMGHPPVRYLTPHFDFHFFTVPAAAVAKIDCKDLTQERPDQIAPGMVWPVAPGTEPAEACVPGMGFHTLPVTEFSGPGQFKPGLFDAVMIGGYYGGKYQFVEPMVAKASLQKRQSFTLPVPLEPVYGKATRVPTTFKATYNAATDSYDFVFSGFRAVAK